MKRCFSILFVLIFIIGAFCGACSNPASAATTTKAQVPITPEVTQDHIAVNSKVPVSGVRIVVDGTVHTYDVLLADGDWYLLPADINEALGIEVEPTLDGYANLREAIKTANYSYEHDSVLNAAYIWTNETYYTKPIELNKAVTLGFIARDYANNPDRQISAAEYRTILLALVRKAAPEKASWFEENVTGYDKPLLRGEGFVMAYFAAVCVGADIQNNNFDNNKVNPDTYWNSDIFAFDDLFPHVWDGPIKFSGGLTNEWYNYYVAAFLWSFWYSSPLSGMQVFEYDAEKESMRQDEPLTVQEAVCAAIRVYEGADITESVVPIDDPAADTFDTTIITGDLLARAASLPAVDGSNILQLRGFVLSDGGSYDSRNMKYSDSDLRMIANWGFKSIRLMVTYQTFFDKNVTHVNLDQLKKLDSLIAAAMKYNIHINLLTFSLPGRWTSFDYTTYKTTGDLDLFTNQSRQLEANRLWALITNRYKGVPNSILSFCPIWEAQNHALSSGLPVPKYSDKDVANVYVQVIQTIKEIDPSRTVVFEPTANNVYQDIIKESSYIRDAVLAKFPDAIMMSNFCEMPFVYAEMTAESDKNIDMQNHSMFKPDYPTTIYAAQYHLDKNTPFVLDGTLKGGTTIDIYLSRVSGNGTFTISADSNALYSEKLTSRTYKADSPLSRYYPYAKSEKLIHVTLPSDAEKVEINFDGQSFEWSGIDIILPEDYSVQRWWFMSSYDALLKGVEFTKPELRSTSTISLSPNSFDSGNPVTIHEDITYSSPDIVAQSNRKTIDDWVKSMSEYSPTLIVRFENAHFNIGCAHDSAMRYYSDLLAALDQYGMGWYFNDYDSILSADRTLFAGIKPVMYSNGRQIDAEMMKLLQSYQ